jgi:hypothetical protein
MARLPDGFHWVSGKNKKLGATGPGGQHVTRQAAENMGAREYGFKTAYEQRKLGKSVAEGLARQGRTTPAGINYANGLRRAQAAAQRRGQKFDKSRFDSAVGGLRAAHGRKDQAGLNSALGQYRYVTGQAESPEAGSGSG